MTVNDGNVSDSLCLLLSEMGRLLTTDIQKIVKMFWIILGSIVVNDHEKLQPTDSKWCLWLYPHPNIPKDSLLTRVFIYNIVRP